MYNHESYKKFFFVNHFQELKLLLSLSSEVESAGELEDAQFEFWYNGQQMIKDIRLYAFVFNPAGVVGENVDFDGQAVGRRLQLAYEESHILTNFQQ